MSNYFAFLCCLVGEDDKDDRSDEWCLRTKSLLSLALNMLEKALEVCNPIGPSALDMNINGQWVNGHSLPPPQLSPDRPIRTGLPFREITRQLKFLIKGRKPWPLSVPQHCNPWVQWTPLLVQIQPFPSPGSTTYSLGNRLPDGAILAQGWGQGTCIVALRMSQGWLANWPTWPRWRCSRQRDANRLLP